MLDPLSAADILADLGFLLAPVIGPLGGILAKSGGDEGALASLLDGDDDNDASVGDALEKAVLGFFSRFDKAKQREFITMMAKMTRVVMPDDKEPRLPDVFTPHFKGRIGAMYRWFFFAMKVQFKDFFSGQGFDMSRLQDLVKAKAQE